MIYGVLNLEIEIKTSEITFLADAAVDQRSQYLPDY